MLDAVGTSFDFKSLWMSETYNTTGLWLYYVQQTSSKYETCRELVQPDPYFRVIARVMSALMENKLSTLYYVLTLILRWIRNHSNSWIDLEAFLDHLGFKKTLSKSILVLYRLQDLGSPL